MNGWRQLETPWYATDIVHCQLCGQMIAGQVWVVEQGDAISRFCDSKCERTYNTYWAPRYERSAAMDAGPQKTDSST